MDKIYRRIYNEKVATITIFIGFSILLSISVLFLSKGSWILKFSDDINEEKIAQLGDFVGGVVGTIFSLVGIILFYIALKEQRLDFKTNQDALKMQLEAFKQQINEFELQREELGETRKIFEQQTKTMRNQQFESNFYSLLNVFINNRLKFLGNNLFTEVINRMKVGVSNENIERTSESIHKNYYNEYLANRADLAMYFMTLYRLFKIIEECPHFNNDEKIYYHKILRSQISKDELLVLYYNYHSDFGKKPLPIALKYNYFKHLEVLSKLEFEIPFTMELFEIIHFNGVLFKIKELIYRNIEKAKELTENETKEEIEIHPNVYIGVYIDEFIEVKLVLKSTISEINNIDILRYKLIIKSILIDILYSAKFEKFNSSFLKESITTTTEQIDYNFKFLSQDE